MNIEYQIAVVQHYIHVRKDVVIQINLLQFQDFHNVRLLQDAFTIAQNWLMANSSGITINQNYGY